MTEDNFITNLSFFPQEWMIKKTLQELDELYATRNMSTNASYFPVNTSDFLSREGIQWFIDKGLELREEAWMLGSIPNNKMIKHTDFSPCCFTYNLLGSYDIYWLSEKDMVDYGQLHTMDYPFQPGGKNIKCTKYLDIKYKDEDNLPIIAKGHSGTNEFTLIETHKIHYGVSGPERFLFWSPRPLDITLDYTEVKRRIFS